MILLVLIIFVLSIWLINKLLFGELFGGDDDESSSPINDARWQQRNQFQQYQQFQQRERERQNRRYEDGPVIIEKADAQPVKQKRRAIGDFGEYVEYREVND